MVVNSGILLLTFQEKDDEKVGTSEHKENSDDEKENRECENILAGEGKGEGERDAEAKGNGEGKGEREREVEAEGNGEGEGEGEGEAEGEGDGEVEAEGEWEAEREGEGEGEGIESIIGGEGIGHIWGSYEEGDDINEHIDCGVGDLNNTLGYHQENDNVKCGGVGPREGFSREGGNRGCDSPFQHTENAKNISPSQTHSAKANGEKGGRVQNSKKMKASKPMNLASRETNLKAACEKAKKSTN